MAKQYVGLKIEISNYSEEDVITTSIGVGYKSDWDNFWNGWENTTFGGDE